MSKCLKAAVADLEESISNEVSLHCIPNADAELWAVKSSSMLHLFNAYGVNDKPNSILLDEDSFTTLIKLMQEILDKKG